jgi:hypothetical protein
MGYRLRSPRRQGKALIDHCHRVHQRLLGCLPAVNTIAEGWLSRWSVVVHFGLPSPKATMFYALGLRSRKAAVRCAGHCPELAESLRLTRWLTNLADDEIQPPALTAGLTDHVCSRVPRPVTAKAARVALQTDSPPRRKVASTTPRYCAALPVSPDSNLLIRLHPCRRKNVALAPSVRLDYPGTLSTSIDHLRTAERLNLRPWG